MMAEEESQKRLQRKDVRRFMGAAFSFYRYNIMIVCRPGRHTHAIRTQQQQQQQHVGSACAAGVLIVTGTAGRDGSRYYLASTGTEGRARKPAGLRMNAVELNRHTTCMETRGSVVS